MWTQQTSSAQWSGRCETALVTIGSSVILMGGRSSSGFNNDVYISVDNGKTWTLRTASAQWPGRNFHSSIVMGTNIFIIGAGGDGGGN